MTKIKYVQDTLFNAPKGTVLVHACNAEGVWGSGIAKEFKERFPNACNHYFQAYKTRGTAVYFSGFDSEGRDTNEPEIGCLITSRGYGGNKDYPALIKVSTTFALKSLMELTYNGNGMKFASNKFNSGLFNVPWDQTEEILEVFVRKYKLDWTIYNPTGFSEKPKGKKP